MFSQKWIEDGLTGQISHAKLRILLAKLRHKILDTDYAVQARSENPRLTHDVTVEDAVKALYTELANYDFIIEDEIVDLGLVGVDPVEYMKAIGVYTGKNGEQSLDQLCTFEQACVMATRLITTLYDGLDVASKGFLWEVNNGNNTAYLLGSIHLATTDIYPFSQTMYRAFAESDALVLEADLYNIEEIIAFSQLQYYDDGTSLKDYISPELYETVIEIYGGYGVAEENVSLAKPWAIALEFGNLVAAEGGDGEGLTANLGIDMHFNTLAYLYQKPVYQIEGAYNQGLVFESFSAELQEMFLLESARELLMSQGEGPTDLGAKSSSEILAQWLQCWHDGDVEKFEEIFVMDIILDIDEENLEFFDEETKKIIKELNEEYIEKMLTQRDENMADYIDNLLQAEGSNSYFVIVGSAHYISDYSVLDLLEEMGYELNQIK